MFVIPTRYPWQTKYRRFYCTVLYCTVALTATSLPISAEEEKDNGIPFNQMLNWKPLSELSPEQLAEVPSACCGQYLPPIIENLPDDQESLPLGSYIIDADHFSGNTNTKFTATGNVTVVNGQQNIKAESISVDREQQTSDVVGPIVINEAQALFLGQKAQVNQETGAARIEDGYFVLYQSRIRGGASVIDRDENQVMTLSDGEITQCEPGSEDWIIKGSEIQIDPNTEKGTIRDMRLELGGVPVFYMPYWTFPAGSKSQSGFLFPSISLKDYQISDFSLPYYFNLAPNYDLIVAPRYIYNRGSMLELEGRHLNRTFDTVLSTAWLGNGEDSISDNEQEAIDNILMDTSNPNAASEAAALAAAATEFDGQDRWLVSLLQNGGARSEGSRQAQQLFGTSLPQWYSQIDFTRVSDYAFFRHVDTSNLNINRQTHLLQRGDLGYDLGNWVVNLHAESYQSITLGAEEPYRQLPKLNLTGQYQWALSDSNLQFELENEITSFRHREEFINNNTNNPRIVGERARFDYKLSWEKQWLWGYLKPALALKSVSYRLDPDTLAPNADSEPGVTVPQAILDGGLFFERDGSWFGSDYLQTFEPRVFYFYSDYENQDGFFNLSAIPDPNNTRTNDDINFDTAELTFGYSQLFRDTRFAGGDRIDDANQYSIGLTTRFLDRRSGQERLRLSLGQIFYNQDRRVTLNRNPNNNTALQTKSEIAGQIAAQLTDSWQLSGDALFDPARHQWNQSGVSLRYYDDEQQSIVNLGYRHQRNPSSTSSKNLDQEQAELSFVLPITGDWSVIGHTFHDFTAEEALDSMLGVEYSSCCYRLRLIGRRWIDNELIEIVNSNELEHERGIFFELQLRGLGNVFDTIDGVLSESIFNYDRREEAIR